MGIHVILAEKQQQLCDDLLSIEDLHERLGAVVDRGRRRPGLTAAERTDAARVRGCISAVWLVGELREGRCYFRSDADGPLVRGLVALLCDFFSGATPAEIVASDRDPLVALRLMENLSPTRRNGLTSARAAIVVFAEAHQANQENRPTDSPR
ncbi:MAG: SufE family protein [Opitutaceae bacterium]